jgi:hypothetical protein
MGMLLGVEGAGKTAGRHKLDPRCATCQGYDNR